MEKKMIKVSVVIPIYNAAVYLRECLDTVVGQTLKQIEIVCVNDGSTDNSLEIIKEYQAKDSRVKIIDKPNGGYGHSMNVGMDAATGEYIGIVEPDDFVDKHMFRDLYRAAKRHDCDVVKSDHYRFETCNKKIVKNYIPTPTKAKYYHKVINGDSVKDILTFTMNTWTGIYRTSFLRDNKIRHNETPGAAFQDNGLFFKSTVLAKRMYFLPKAYYYHRLDNPNSSINSKAKVFCMCDEYKFIKEFIDSNPEVKRKYLPYFFLKKCHNYNFTYQRVAQEHKLAFLERYAREFNEDIQKGEFVLDELPDADSFKEEVGRIITDYQDFYFDETMHRLNSSYKKLSWQKNQILKQLDKLHGRNQNHALNVTEAVERKIRLVNWAAGFCQNAELHYNEQENIAKNIVQIFDKHNCDEVYEMLDINAKDTYHLVSLMALSSKNFDKKIKAYNTAIDKIKDEIEELKKDPKYKKVKLDFGKKRSKKSLISKCFAHLHRYGFKVTMKKVFAKLSRHR